jgi:predicted alpha/beta-hydrolase family hydrolase
VPPATDAPPTPDVTQSEEYLAAQAEIRHELDEGELHVKGQREGFPPTHYDRT